MLKSVSKVLYRDTDFQKAQQGTACPDSLC